MTDYQLLSTNALLHLNKVAVDLDLNESMHPDLLAMDLDPEGLHVLQRVLLHNDKEYRCQILMKTNGSDEPVTGWLDVPLEVWTFVAKVDAVIREALGDMELPT